MCVSSVCPETASSKTVNAGRRYRGKTNPGCEEQALDPRWPSCRHKEEGEPFEKNPSSSPQSQTTSPSSSLQLWVS